MVKSRLAQEMETRLSIVNKTVSTKPERSQEITLTSVV